MSEERRKDYPDMMERLKHIETLLMGNGKIGVAEMARRAFEYMQVEKTTKNGLVDWAFRIAIMIVLTFIAVKVGIK